MANLGAVMDDLGTALDTITGLRVFDFPPKSAQPPFAFVDMPTQVDFDLAFRRGQDRMTINVVVCVPDVVDRVARDRIAEYAAGAGASSIKQVLEAAAGAWSSLRVASVEFRPVALAGQAYAGAVFAVDITF